MTVQLYTSRVVLDKLGADDYGLYNVVGGVVGLLSFLTGTLGIGTSRFITYEFGAGDAKKLKSTFVTSFYTHLALSALIIILLETIGLWFFYNHLVIPSERLDAALWVYQISILTTIVAITQVPYTSAIMAHEKMDIYAYLSIFEAIAKLIVAYLLSIAPYDKMLFYAILIAIVQILLASFYRFFCVNKFQECRLNFSFDKSIFKKLIVFSGWNITANIAEMLKAQGVIVLINMFFQPAIVAAQAIGNQITNAMMQFINNIRTAVNPQVIKLYASGDYEGSKRLTLKSSLYIFDLLLLLGLPFILLMEPILNLWLKDVPPYTVVFAQCIVASEIIGNFSASFYIPMMAANKIKKNSIAAVIFSFSNFIILYLILKLGGDVMWVQYVYLFYSASWSYFIKPYILYKDIDYNIPEMAKCILCTFKVGLLSCIIAIPARLLLKNSIIECIALLIISLFAVFFSSYIFMYRDDRQKALVFIVNKIKQRR